MVLVVVLVGVAMMRNLRKTKREETFHPMTEERLSDEELRKFRAEDQQRMIDYMEQQKKKSKK